TAQSLSAEHAAAAERRAPALRVGEMGAHHHAELELRAPLEKSWPAVYAELFKARLTFLVLLTALVGFYLGSNGRLDYLLMLHVLLGTALVAASAAALNQWLERDYDAKMHRTQN